MIKATHLAALIALAFVAAGCADFRERSEEQRKNVPDFVQEERGLSSSRLLGGSLAGGGDGPGVPVNRSLWSASLDTLSFLPLESVDPFTGVIVTGWGSANASRTERFKATVLINSEQLAASSLKVALFRQVNEDGAWVDALVAPELVRQVEDAILLRARQLRIAQSR